MHLFTLILNKYDGGDLPAENSRKVLLKLCATHSIESHDLDCNVDIEDIIEDSIFEENESYEIDWLDKIISNVNIVNNENKDDHDNLYYFPEFKKSTTLVEYYGCFLQFRLQLCHEFGHRT